MSSNTWIILLFLITAVTANTCKDDEFHCVMPDEKGKEECITRMWLCDGEPECYDGSDEANCANYTCPGMFQCQEFGPCISLDKKCDHEEDCMNTSDEKNCNFTCTDNQFMCDNNECMSMEWRCDGDIDCMNGEDEHNCTCLDSNMFNCSDGTCISKDRQCDETIDCPDHSDELNCKYLTDVHCASDKVPCALTRECIHADYICDGTHDCRSGSDEFGCQRNNCSTGQFSCLKPHWHNSTTIVYDCLDESKRCNGVIECLDHSDEYQADGTPCKSILNKCQPDEEFDCTGEGKECIAIAKVCNGVEDCKNKHDEKKCTTPHNNTCITNNGGCHQLCIWKNKQNSCACYPGYHLIDDSNCEDTNECLEPGRCSQICENTPRRNFTCSCHEGYHRDSLNTHLCIADGDPGFLLVALKIDIRKFNLHTKEYTMVANQTVSAISLDFDFNTSSVFWSNLKFSKIVQQSMITNSGPEVLLQNGMEASDGLTYDWIHKNIYWTDTGLNKIGVMSTENNPNFDHRILFNYNLDEPRAIVVDPRDNQGWFYWTDWGKVPSIERASLDGSNRSIIFTGDQIVWANGLTIDFVSNHLYWCDAKLANIQRINLDGSGIKLILHSTHMLRHPFSITVFQDTLYWTDWNTDAIHSASKFNGSNTRVVQKVHTPMGLVVYHKLRQPHAKNRCGTDNGGCSDLCLPVAYSKHAPSTFRCLCTSSRSLGVDMKTCYKDLEVSTKAPVSHKKHGSKFYGGYVILIFIFVISAIVLVSLLGRKFYLKHQGKPLNFENTVYRKTTNQISIETEGFQSTSDRIPLVSEA